MNITNLFEHLIEGHNLSPSEMQHIIQEGMSGVLSDTQIAVFLALMRMKGETVEELTSAATAMKQLAHSIDLGTDLFDIVGTGGDGKHTFNISTVSSFVAAAAGLRIAKHGNRAVSSRSGSADFLLQAGFNLELSDDALRKCLDQCGITFLFAPHFHQAMQYVKNARQALGIRTLFNLLGPLINPANVTRQVVGVSNKHWLIPIANVLANLGSQSALILCSDDGLDEISIAASTEVLEYHEGELKQWHIDPKEYNCYHPNLQSIIVATPLQSLQLADSVFAGEKGAARDIILLNAAAALYCSGLYPIFGAAVEAAATAIDSGLAGQRFVQLRDLTQTLKGNLE